MGTAGALPKKTDPATISSLVCVLSLLVKVVEFLVALMKLTQNVFPQMYVYTVNVVIAM